MTVMTNPILVDITRGPAVESRHRGAISVVDGDGATVLELGDTALPVFPRSAIKAVQALPLVESGAADAYGFGSAQLALACSSHSGEDDHISNARQMLESAGRSVDDLECGGHWSSHQHVLIHQARTFAEPPGAVYNNCSGKHAGFICTAAHMGLEPKDYIKPTHPIMQQVKAALEDVTGTAHVEELRGTDGCSIPTYAVPLRNMAHGFAKMASGNNLGSERAKAAQRLLQACMDAPFYMAGSHRFCTRLMMLGKGRLFAKTGAEGVYCGAIPELGYGIALKCDDGTTRAAEAMMAATMQHILPKDDPLQEALSALSAIELKNRTEMRVGTIQAKLPV